MLLIDRHYKKVALEWSSIESISFDDSERPNVNLMITTKSGGGLTVLNPTHDGAEVSFEAVVNAWLNNYTCWDIKENGTKNAPIHHQFLHGD